MANTPFALLKVIAKALGNALGGGVAGDLLIEVLPEVAKDGWEWWTKEKNEKERRTELQVIVQTSNLQLQQEIKEIVRSELSNQPQIIQQTVELYLTQMPDSIRHSLRRLDDPSGTTVPANLMLHKADDLLRLLPSKLAHFKPGDRPLAGVDWQLVQLLGVGGFGEVWLAHNPYFQSAPPVALKFCIDPLAARTLRNEASMLDQVMRQGHHPGIVQLLRTYLSANPPCLEYEFVPGGDLGGLILEWHRQAEGPSPQQAARVVLRLAEIVAIAHQANPPIVHRDLKPANILVAKEKGEIQFKIADFGIGGVVAQQTLRQSQAGMSRGQRLVTGLRGSHSQMYASPQQMLGNDPDPCDDLFALGVIWYQLLTGNLSQGRPGGRRWSQTLVERGMSDALIDLLAACFEEEPADRPADAGILAKELAKLLAMENRPAATIALPTPQPVIIPTVTKRAPIDFDWVTIPAGEFLMGSDKAKDKDAMDRELPQHKLYLPAYKIARVPVTVAQFAQFVTATNYKTTAEQKGSAWSWAEQDKKWQWVEIKGAYWAAPRGAGSDVRSKQNHPVTCVSWHDVLKFCEWAGVRLPSEAEWERAARGTSGRLYPWGNEAPDQSRGNYNLHVGDTTPVGNYPKGATPEGLQEMAGNVWEWTISLWGKDASKPDFGYPYKVGDGREHLSAGDDVCRLLRGGSWNGLPYLLRGAFRNGVNAEYRSFNVGFRVVVFVVPGG